ncbi:hypothetical protein MNBD_GAMMA16-1547 [hydrothermal vent metagenome]|uniref:Uncharacterized protein n=1 Tax=hydrothermal vent metagenome TaxID=652676 RepID=A0A3B0Z372_9ZZZZ
MKRLVVAMAAYTLVAFLLALAFLYPGRPAIFSDWMTITVALLPLVGIFDLLSENIMDSAWLKSLPQVAKPIVGITVLGIFLAGQYWIVQLIGITTIPW